MIQRRRRTPAYLALGLVSGLAASACRRDQGPAPLGTVEPQLASVPENEIAVWPDEAFRATRPEPGEAPQLHLPELARFTLSNGLEVYFLRETQLPIARMWFEFDLGTTRDPVGKAGLHEVCFDLLDEGTKDLDKVAFEAKLDDRALRLWSSPGAERSTLAVSSLVSEMPAALEAAREVLSSPGMRKADFDRLRDQAVEGLAQQRAMAVSVAYRLLPSLVYGSDHPYGAFSTEQTLKRVSVRDCVRMAKELGPKGARLFVSAKTDLETLRTTLESGLGGWKGDAPAPAKPKAAAGKMRRLVFVDMPGSAQSTVIMASTGPERDAADYSATSIMARILGGSFSSRLNMNLREDKGYAYGARGGFSYHREGSHLFASARVRADATADSVQQIFNEVAAVREGPLREEELTRERDGALAALPGDFGTSTTSIGSFRELVFYGLPLDWHAREAERLAALTLDDVEAAGREHLPTDAYLVLVVGDGAQVRDGLRELATTRELAFVEVDVDGKPR